MSITERPYGHYEGKIIKAYTLANSAGMEVTVLSYGGTVTRICTPDRNGRSGNVVLGFTSFGAYLQPHNPYFGALIGRFANRIANSCFRLNGKEYRLGANDNGHSLHGGLQGFDKVVWDAAIAGKNTLQLCYRSPDGEQGYPGNLQVTVQYRLTDGNELELIYRATTDQPTPVNLTSHCYFNLSAGSDATILDHILSLSASRYLPVDDTLIPTGALLPVSGSLMDFREPQQLRRCIGRTGGYDHTWIPDSKKGVAATLFHEASGRYLEVFTTAPGIQCYTGNMLDGRLTGMYEGQGCGRHAGLCLEAQHFPDSPNQLYFPNTILNPEDTYRQTTVYRFSVR